MAFQGYQLLGLVVLLSSFAISVSHETASFNRSTFPAGFIFGTASSSYQYEGAASKGGRGPSIWDTFTHRYPDKIKDGSNGDVAIDQYHHYKEDVGIMKDMGLDAYRLSVSWTRVLPNGKLSGGVNREGINYYNKLINELLDKGLKPFVTIFHWDLPQPLEDEYGGFLSPQIVHDFQDYAELCFKEFGDRVKHWITLIEPYTFSSLGYASGQLAPGRCSAWQNLNCIGGNSGTEPYLVTHHQLLAHAATVKVYKEKYQAVQKGVKGIALVSQWMEPYSKAKHHRDAALRALDFEFGWFMDPLTNGDYPHSMRSLVGKRLPKFTREQSKLLIGSFDFIGLNYYTANYAANAPHLNAGNLSAMGSPLVHRLLQIGSMFIPKEYMIFCSTQSESTIIHKSTSLRMELMSSTMLPYRLRKPLWTTKELIITIVIFCTFTVLSKHGVNINGYFAWTLLDDFEWNSGYTIRFGINFVDYKDGFKRYLKLSARWFKNFLSK